ncbi:hypothetical protein LAZ67_3001017 [Cordylochernes scorpioides]|uniref:Uncharacterized protein n=1 Tax=Cordylochernes scorpioides TaxID=51811 RepID=A0ABY6K9Y8_9ARAC|nr:hypothetical protein LAZ67_3001017 [Cordylochernes scorpioides]
MIKILRRPSSTVINPPSYGYDFIFPNGVENAIKDVCVPQDIAEDQGSDDTMPITDGQYSLLQFALNNFRDCPDKYEMLKNQEESKRGGPIKLIESLKFSRKNKKDKTSDWTWKELVDLVKFSKVRQRASLLYTGHRSDF